jgi:hypothetical protein
MPANVRALEFHYVFLQYDELEEMTVTVNSGPTLTLWQEDKS